MMPIIWAERPNWIRFLGLRRVQLHRHPVVGRGRHGAGALDGARPTAFDLAMSISAGCSPFRATRPICSNARRRSLGLLYADHFPYRQMATARGSAARRSMSILKREGAVFGEVAGWERANWFADEGQSGEYEYSWKRQNWFDNSKREHEAVRNNVGMYDMTSSAKSVSKGRMPRLSSTTLRQRLSVPVGKIVYTQFLNDAAASKPMSPSPGCRDSLLVVTPAATRYRDLSWMERHAAIPRVITDVTSAKACWRSWGRMPASCCEKVSPHDWSNDEPVRHGAEIETRHGPRPRSPRHLCRRAGLGTLHARPTWPAHAFETLFEAGRTWI